MPDTTFKGVVGSTNSEVPTPTAFAPTTPKGQGCPNPKSKIKNPFASSVVFLCNSQLSILNSQLLLFPWRPWLPARRDWRFSSQKTPVPLDVAELAQRARKRVSRFCNVKGSANSKISRTRAVLLYMGKPTALWKVNRLESGSWKPEINRCQSVWTRSTKL